MSLNRLRVGVLMGGKSIEKEVSFNSGRTMCDHLDTARYEVIPLFQTGCGDLFILPWHFLHRGKISDFESRLHTQAKQIIWDDLKQLVDFIYPAMHGRFAEDGTLQGFLEILGIPYFGSKVLGSAIGMNKMVQKNILRAHGIAVPNGITLTPQQIDLFATNEQSIFGTLAGINLSLPYIVKPSNEGSSLGVYVVQKKEQLLAALKQASSITPGTRQVVLVEEKIEGMEFSCTIITDYKTGNLVAMPPTEIVPEIGIAIFDYDQKYMPGRANKFTPARCTPAFRKKIQDTCRHVMRVLTMSNISRTDGFLTKDGTVVIVDPNTLTGMAPSSFFFREAAQYGMNHTQLINHLIETELHNYGMLTTIIKREKKVQTSMKEKKIRVAVLLGGQTSEKEISLESGRNIIYKLSPQKYEPITIFVSSTMELFIISPEQLVLNATHEIEKSLDKKTKINWHDLPTIADFVFIGLHGGCGENGSVQGALEMLELPYNGSSVLTSALCTDKFKTAQYLKQKGFAVPDGMLISKQQWQENKTTTMNNIIASLSFPLIVKPHDDGCSTMVTKANNKKKLIKDLDLFFNSNRDNALIEQCIGGMELTIGVIGNESAQALPPSQALSTGDILSIEEKFLPGAGENQTPAPLAPKVLASVQKTIQQVYTALGCSGYARIDCFYQNKTESPTGKEQLVILEINTLPGMTPATCIFHQAAEINMRPMDFIDNIIKLGLEKHKKPALVKKPRARINKKVAPHT